nr:ubiquitin carboxyl-terminal hydrolase 40-like [Pocillopora verrucosa]
MFGSLFETDEEGSKNSKSGTTGRVSKQNKLNWPPQPRGVTGICGLQNQGATCYLNSLLQTLFFIPEFRDGLFRLTSEDLSYDPRGGTYPKVRVIPHQLQKLFAKLLLLDQDSVNTSQLTDSFGWTGNEGFQQHDVQELSRILFGALESSLLGTPGEALIKNLYHGTSVTKVTCQECWQVSEREEDYLDLPLVLSGCKDLQESLSMSYAAMEILEGRNQYKCGSCNKLVNATKGSNIRTLPPILTFSLLRFDYDFQKGERVKDCKRYSFPVTLNMKDFCESSDAVEADQEYQLFSVVIHGGSCYGGHYHVYIRDVEGVRTWHPPEKKQVKVVKEDDGGEEDVINCGNPVDLIISLLKKLGGAASVNQLCQYMSKETGISWNKGFKSQYGSLTKFFKKNPDVFRFSDASGYVSLQNGIHENSNKTSLAVVQEQGEPGKLVDDVQKRNSQPVLEGESLPEHGHCWFDINDSRISCIHEKDLQSQFAGKESAYMLFYRRKNLSACVEDPALLVPAPIRAEVDKLNEDLVRQRKDYDCHLNEISVSVHFGNNYTMTDSVLQIKQGVSVKPLIISLDRRKSVNDLLKTVLKLDMPGNDAECNTLHIARQLPSGLHLFEELTEYPEKSLIQSGVSGGTDVFLWNGKEIDGYSVYPGEDSAPVLLNITYSTCQLQDTVEIQKHFRKDTTVGEMKIMMSNFVRINFQDLRLSWVKSKGKTKQIMPIDSDQDGNTLHEIGLQDGDQLVAEEKEGLKSSEQGPPKLASEEKEKASSLMSFEVENRCLMQESKEQIDNDRSTGWPVLSVEIHKEQTVGDLKAKVLELADCNGISETACRLRSDSDCQGLSAPVYEHETLEESWLNEGQRLVLEHKPPLLQGEIMIRYYVCSPIHTSRKEEEQTVLKSCTIRECLQLLMEDSNLQGMSWHLRKTNWIGEPTDLLDNEEETLENKNIKNGDTLIVEEGRLPPKGFIRLNLWQTNSGKAKNQHFGGVLNWITSGVQGLLGSSTVETSGNDDNAKGSDSLEPLGDVEISKESSLYDLKLQISHMPQLSDHVIPTPLFVRLQEVVDNHATRVLRGTNQTLRQLKLTSSTQLSVCVLQHKEDLSSSAVLLRLKKRMPRERCYYDEQEVIFEPPGGATPEALHYFVGKVCDIPLEKLNVAKYLRAKYEWLVIKDTDGTQNKKKGRKKKINLRQSPVYLQDGDVIGVKNCQSDSEDNDDFSTPADDEGKEKLKREEEEKKMRRKEKRARRPEVPLCIHVDEFR